METFVRAQGATEYLVLLAVVLVVALVSVALLGFFPGMASAAQITQSQMYWKGASPISIIESGAVVAAESGDSVLYLRFRNSGSYPIRITGIVGGDGTKTTQFCGTSCGAPCLANISDYFYLGSGEEKYLSEAGRFGTACNWVIVSITSASGSWAVGGASSICQNPTVSPGVLDYKSLGFEYVEYIDGQQITKKQIGKGLIIKCKQPF